MLKLGDDPSISVVIPSLNQGNYIEETLLSVIGQNYPNLEIIVMDGGSTDNTIEVIEKYSHNISYWQSKPDKGQADAINQGMNLSSGDILCWLNTDDMYLPGTLLDIGSRLRNLTDQNYLIYGATLLIKHDLNNLYSIAHPTVPFNALALTYNDFIPQPSAFWTRKVWDAAGELDNRYNYVLDWDWFIRASKVAKFDSISKFYSIYRSHPFNKTNNGSLDRRKEILNVVKNYSSDYWTKLYFEVEQNYPKIRDFIQLSKIPKRHFLLPIFFPKIASVLAKIDDLYTVLTMYG